MHLFQTISNLDKFDDYKDDRPYAIFAIKPWDFDSESQVLLLPEDGGLPEQTGDFEYCIEIGLAKEFVDDFSELFVAEPDDITVFLRLMYYIVNDA